MKKARMKRKNDNKLKGKPGGEFEDAVESGISEAISGAAMGGMYDLSMAAAGLAGPLSKEEVLNNSPERLLESKISKLIKMDQGEAGDDPERATFNNAFSEILDDIEKQAPDTAFTLRERLRDEYNGIDNRIDPRTGNELSDSPGWRDDFSEDTPRPFPQGMEDEKITKKIRETVEKSNREQSDSEEMRGEEFDRLFKMVTGNPFDSNSSMDQGKMEVLKKAKAENPDLSDSQLALKIYKDYM
jgi:hypothetical protein